MPRVSISSEYEYAVIGDVSADLFASYSRRKAHSFGRCKIEPLVIKCQYFCCRMFLILVFQIHTAVDITAEVANKDCVGSSVENTTGVWNMNFYAYFLKIFNSLL
jgi:hypothetical protein